MFFLQFFQGIYTFFIDQPQYAWGRLLLVAIGILLIYLAYKHVLEPLIMLPLGIGMIAVNAGLMVLEVSTASGGIITTGLRETSHGLIGNLFINPPLSNVDELTAFLQVDFLQPIYTYMFSNGLIACLVFLGIGAITDIDILLARPGMSFFLAIFAELGTILVLPIAMGMGFLPGNAAATALIGGADGPMVLYGSLLMAPDLFIPITIVAYVYLGITYAGYPFLARIIPRKMRGIEMNWRDIPKVSAGKKFAFCIATFTLLSFLFPVATPLFASFFLGLAVKEAGITRFEEFLSGPLLYGSTLFLGFTLGSLMGVDVLFNPKVLLLLVLGVIALTLSGLGGIAGGLIYSKFSKKPFNPLLGLAAVSCVPTTAKVAQKCAFAVNRKAMILNFAMGPNVAGVITTAIITGIYIAGVRGGFLVG